MAYGIEKREKKKKKNEVLSLNYFIYFLENKAIVIFSIIDPIIISKNEFLKKLFGNK